MHDLRLAKDEKNSQAMRQLKDQDSLIFVIKLPEFHFRLCDLWCDAVTRVYDVILRFEQLTCDTSVGLRHQLDDVTRAAL